MFWADKLLEKRLGKELINDSFTPSGMVHMGSLKGPVIHDTLFRVLKQNNKEVEFLYGFDDADPIDGLSPDLQKTHSQYFGVSLFKAPSPDGKGSFADFFINKMMELLKKLDIKPTRIYRTSDLYKEGVFNKSIKLILDNAQKVRNVYSEIYKKEIPSSWFPLQVICPHCGKLSTTKVTGWDGTKVTFCCEKNLVKWAQGCGFCGEISPFDGNSKIPWKVEWAAKWWTFGVTIEAAGKDHASSGGSYDVAIKLSEDIFHNKPPLKIAYEFFLAGGKKMASSKGVGLTGEKLLEVLAPQIVRFLMIKTPPNQAVEFTPKDTDIVPKLYDDYQKSYDAYAQKTDADAGRAFELSQTDSIKLPPSVRFGLLAQYIQMPNMQEQLKKEDLHDWAPYAKVWIEQYALDSEKFLIQEHVPEASKQLSDIQKRFLDKVAKELEKDWNPQNFQKNLYEWAKDLGVPSKEAFAALYISLIGKDHGPKAAWLITSLDKEFVRKRFEEVDSSVILSSVHDLKKMPKQVRHDKIKSEIFSIDSEVIDKFPSVSVGIAIIKGISIEKLNKELEQEKEEVLKSLRGLTTEQINQYPEVQSYRRLYKETGTDWHSRRPSPEALLRRVALSKGLYIVNTCVDAYNLVVMKYRVSIGAFDLDKIIFPTVLRFTRIDEEILLLGDKEPTKYKEGEIAYFDQKGGYNMDFNYRDAQRTAVQTTTKNLYINVDGTYDITPEKVQDVLKEACDKIIKYCGGKIELIGVETSS